MLVRRSVFGEEDGERLLLLLLWVWLGVLREG